MRKEGQQPGGGFRVVLGSPGYRRLLIGQAASALGDWVATLAFIVAAFALTGDQTAVAVVLILRLVPPMFAAPVGGVVADRLPRRTIMVASDLIRAGLIVLVPFVGIGLLYLIAFLHECVSLFFLPARDATTPALVPRASLPEANGLILVSSFGALPVAAAVFGGLRLLAENTPAWVPYNHLFRAHPTSFAFFFDAATFVFSAAMIAGLPLRERRRRERIELVTGVAEGFRYVMVHPALRALAYALIVSMFGGGVLFAIGIAYIHETLGGGDVDFGWLASLWGLGMTLGVGAVRLLVMRWERGVFLAAVTICGGALIVMALLPVLWLAFGVAVVFGAAFAIAIMLALTMAQWYAEDEVRGRMMAGVQMLFRIGLGTGALAIGALANGVQRLRVGTGPLSVTLDGNQVGLLVGGVLILFGAAASSRIARAPVVADGGDQPLR